MKKFCSLVIGATLALFAASTASAFDNITPVEAYDEAVYEGAIILDVRTASEFIWVGHPNIGNVVNISYKVDRKDEFVVNPAFICDVDKLYGAAPDTRIITMCRSGKRSVDAAAALEDAGYTNVASMIDGFQGGGKDEFGYRTVNGWMNSGLPGHTSKIGAGDYYIFKGWRNSCLHNCKD